MSRVLEPRRLRLPENRVFTPAQWDDFFAQTASYLSFIGCVVIKRALWLERDKETYYGSLFIHVGVIFQRPMPDGVLVLAEPMISIRYGNAQWLPQQFEIWMFKWPALLWFFDGISTDAKRAVTAPRRWREIDRLVFYRAQGTYTLAEYRNWIRPRAESLWERFLGMSVACMPSVLANTLAVIGRRALKGRSIPGKPAPDMVLLDLKNSRHYLGNWLVRLRQA